MGRFGINKALHSGDPKQRNKAGMIVGLLVIGSIALLAYWTMYCVMIDMNMRAMGANTGLVAMTFAAVNIICLATTVCKGTGILFGAEDFNIVMPLPIKMREMVTAKLLTLYVSNLSLTVGIMLPAMGVFAWHESPGLLFYLNGLIALLVTPIIPIIIGVVLSLGVSVISARFKHHNIISILLMIIVFTSIMVFSFGMTSMSEQSINALGQNIAQMVDKMYPVTLLFISGVCEKSLMDLLALVGISLVSFGAFVAIIGPKFKVIHTMMNTNSTTKNYRMAGLQTATPLFAMYKRELRRYIASPMYVVNSAFGIIMIIVMAGGVMIKQEMIHQVIKQIPLLEGALPLLVCVAIALCIMMTNTTSISLSMEGKYFQLLKGYPILVMDIFRAKMLANLTMTLPITVVAVPIIGIGCQMSLLQISACYLFVGMYALLGPLFGMTVNLIFPKLEWDNEVVVIKQSVASTLGILGGVPFVLLSCVGLLLVGTLDMSLIIVLLSIVVGIINLILYYSLKTWGVRKFYEI